MLIRRQHVEAMSADQVGYEPQDVIVLIKADDQLRCQ